MRPVFEDRLVDRLCLAQMVALVSGNAREEDLVMAAFDHIDGVDLHIAQVLHRGANRPGPVAKRRGFVEPLGAQPNTSGVGFSEREGLAAFARHGRARGSAGGPPLGDATPRAYSSLWWGGVREL